MIALGTFLLGALLMQLIGRGVDLGVIARRERDAAVGALRELVAAAVAQASKPDSRPSLRESRAWARALALLACYAAPAPIPKDRSHGR